MSRRTHLLFATLVMLGLLGCGDEPAPVVDPIVDPGVDPVVETVGAKTATAEEQAEAQGRIMSLYHLAGAWMHSKQAVPSKLDQILPPPAEGEDVVVPEDPWGHEYELVVEEDKYWIRSLGPDGLPKTEDDLTYPMQD